MVIVKISELFAHGILELKVRMLKALRDIARPLRNSLKVELLCHSAQNQRKTT
jgi:hypothetical protein